MKIVVPYTRVNPATVESLAGEDFEMAYVGDHPNDYPFLLWALWEEHGDLIIVEHDVIVQLGQIEELRRCREPWCSFPEYEGGPPSFSLVRFRWELMAANPDIWRNLFTAHRSQPLWSMCDSWLASHVEVACHLHGPPWAVNTRPWGTLHAV